MKKFLTLTLVVLALFLALASCETKERNSRTMLTTTQPTVSTEPSVHEHTVVTDPAVESTCTKTGLTEGNHCSECGEIFVEQEITPLAPHKEEIIPAVESTCTEHGLTEGKKCPICNTILVEQIEAPLKAHTYDNEEDAICNKCGYERYCVHHNTEILEAVESTCTSTGLTEGKKCSDCEEILVAQEVVSAKEHTESDWIIDVQATIESEGSKHTECTVCGKILKVEVLEKIHSQGLEFALNEDAQSYSVVGIGTCTDIDIIIPSIHNGLPVSSIGEAAFCAFDRQNSTLLTESHCLNINSIIIPDSVVNIGDGAFAYCIKLTTINIPVSVTNIGKQAFIICGSLQNIEVDENNTYYKSIDGNLYTEDAKVLIQYAIGKNDKTFIIPDTVTSIADVAFLASPYLTSMIIHDSVTTIGSYAFSGCSLLSNVKIGDSVTSIGDSAFGSCASLTSITIPDSVTSISERAFNSTPIKEAIIPAIATSSIQKSHLVELTITSGDIVNDAFIASPLLTSLTIGKNVTSVGSYAFYWCKSLTNVTCNATNIGEHAFYLCESLTNVTCNATNIGHEAFAYCSSLTNISLGNSVTYIGDYAFFSCTSLTSIEIPNSVTSISDYTFDGCISLSSITIPNSVTSIGFSAFAGCDALTSITIPDSVTRIDGAAFLDCDALTSITIPESVTSIGNYTFKHCDALTSVTIPDSVTSIGSYAFSGCSSLTSIIIPDSVTSIYNYAFYDCTSLTSIIIPDSVEAIGYNVFLDCPSLTIYCETKSQPDGGNYQTESQNYGWCTDWNPSNRPVVWGYKPE